MSIIYTVPVADCTCGRIPIGRKFNRLLDCHKCTLKARGKTTVTVRIKNSDSFILKKKLPQTNVISLNVLPRCQYDTKPPIVLCDSCNAETREAKNVRVCSHPDNDSHKTTYGINNGDGGIWSCATCEEHTGRIPSNYDISLIKYVAKESDPKVGVVIGAFKWPKLIELQINLIKHTCGNVPILVSDDMHGSPFADRSKVLENICRQYDVQYAPNKEWIGHTGGDLATYWKGIFWGGYGKLDVVAKLSQRMLFTKSRWLQDGAIELLKSGALLSCRKSEHKEYPLRTEAALLNVSKLNRLDILDTLEPKKHNEDIAEIVIKDLITRLEGEYWPWDILPSNRTYRTPNLLWRHSHAKFEYERVAKAFGIKLDLDFKVDGWQGDKDKGVYDRG